MGLPLKKPFCLAESRPDVLDPFHGKLCNGCTRHASAQGQDTRRSQCYAIEFATFVHRAVKNWQKKRCSCKKNSSSSDDLLAAAMLEAGFDAPSDAHTMRQLYLDASRNDVNKSTGDEMLSFLAAMASIKSEPNNETAHRNKADGQLRVGTPMWNALVTLALAPTDPRSRNPQAKAAIQKELDNLRLESTWDEGNVMEEDDAKTQFPDAHFANVFSLVGIKNYEDPDVTSHTYKGRIVLGGHAIKDATGDFAIFQDIGSTPSTMTAARVVLAVAALYGLEVAQSDCVHAYVQANLDGPPTFVRLPKDWWPPEWHTKYKRPVCRLRKALYGHPMAGDCWAEKLSGVLKGHGFKTLEAWPGIFYKHVLKNGKVIPAIMVVYVDDIIMVGMETVPGLLQAIRREVKMEDPAPHQQILWLRPRPQQDERANDHALVSE